MNANTNKRRWFSKKRCIIAVCIIGFLLFLSVAVQTVSNSIRNIDVEPPTGSGEISKAYLAYSFSGRPWRQLEANPGDTAHKAAFILAKYADLNDASIYFIKNDPRAPKNIPKRILLDPEDAGSLPILNPEFMKSVLSFEIVANLPPNAPPTTTPVAWERGLREDGTWSPNSPRKGAGGHIAYLDGHWEWADKLDLNGTCFVKYGTNIPTTDIREALPPGAVILSAEPAKTGQ
jgi:hypothetical protein